MQLIRGHAREHSEQAVIATIGNFDGMHLGHQAIMKRVTDLAQQHNAKACVITFQPLPHEVLAASPPPRLQGTRDRLLGFKQYGMDLCIVLPFNEQLRALDPQAFIANVLMKNLSLHTLIVGDDFRFGHKRAGGFDTLVDAGKQHNFAVEDTPTVLHAGTRISSTRVRACLENNDLEAAESLLGKPYRLSGRVVHGQKVGRQLGFPTANIALKTHQPPLKGVFAVKATCQHSQQQWNAVANLGRRPTVAGLKLLLEVHLLNAKEDLYGKHLHIDFMKHIRGEKKFGSLDELKAQIALDAQAAAGFFA